MLQKNVVTIMSPLQIHCFVATDFTSVASPIAKSQQLKDIEWVEVVVTPLQMCNRLTIVSLQ